MDMNLANLRQMVVDGEAWGAAPHEAQRVGHNLATEQQQPKFVVICCAVIEKIHTTDFDMNLLFYFLLCCQLILLLTDSLFP